jgi:acyl-coenzyme A thioesterase PaaI-like protein
MTTTDVASETLARTGGLVESTRRLMHASVTSSVDAATMNRARELVDEASDLLERQTRDHGIRAHLDRAAIRRTKDGEPWRVFAHNPLGVPLKITIEGERAIAVLEPSPLLEGPPKLLHGGFSAAMMDALLSTLAQVQDRRVVTVHLDVSFLRAVPLDRSLRLVGEVTSVEGRKVRAQGVLEYDGEVAVRAEALFIEIPGDPD